MNIKISIDNFWIFKRDTVILFYYHNYVYTKILLVILFLLRKIVIWKKMLNAYYKYFS